MADVIKFSRGENLGIAEMYTGKIIATETRIFIELPMLRTQSPMMDESLVQPTEVGVFVRSSDEDQAIVNFLNNAKGDSFNAGLKVVFSGEKERLCMNIEVQFAGKKVYTGS